jgi:hypothetical protein
VIWLILGALVAVAAVVVVSLPFLRDDGEPELIDTSGDDVLELMEERDRALAALKELEFDHRVGNVDDADYRASVGALRRQAAAALQALDRYRAEREAGSAGEYAEEQEDVEPGDDRGDRPRDNGRQAAVDEVAHHVAARREPDERDERERDPEREHDLRDHERS